MIYSLPMKKSAPILALGAESAGNFSVYNKGKLYFSEDFGDLLDENNWESFKRGVLTYLKINKIKPQIILTDLHPLFNTTLWGKELAQKYKAEYIQIQHHHAHIFSAIGDKLLTSYFLLPSSFYGVACDGTGYGLDGKIWGGEVFQITNNKLQISNKLQVPSFKFQISRIGHLENQVMIGGDLAIKEPARMLIAILAKITNYKLQITNKYQIKNSKSQKDFIYKYVEKYYTRNEFELLYNQLQQNFNCLETSSAGRVLDAVSLLLGFCENVRNYKHEPIDLLERNSTKPYTNLKPKIKEITDPKSQITNYQLLITPLFEYLLKYLPGNVDDNVPRDKGRLAATAQLYLTQGLWEIISAIHYPRSTFHIFFAGGLANNKIISDYLISKGAYVSKKVHPVKFERSEAGEAVFNGVPRGDTGLSLGQVVYFLLLK